MKTRNACALRSFNSLRILQRPYFRDLHLPNATDSEILQNYDNSESIEELEKNLNTLENLLAKATSYQKFLIRHGERLNAYAQAVATKIATDENSDIQALRDRFKRANKLLMDYCGYSQDTEVTKTFYIGGLAIMDVGRLCSEIAEKYKKLDEGIRQLYRKTFADRLKVARQATKLTQKKFAAKLNMSQNGYSQYESGQRDPSIPMLIKLSKLLNRSADWLLGQVAW